MKRSFFMKKSISLMLVIAMIATIFSMCGITSFAEDDILSYLEYEINDGEVTITACDESISGDIVIPDTIESCPVTKIEYYAFDNCSNIVSLVIPEGIISMDAISFCTNLEKLTLPASLTEITGDSFWGCESLKEVVVHKDNQNYISVDGVLYTKDMTELLVYPAASERTIYNIPEGVTRIWNWAFSQAYNLTKITVPDTVTDLGEGTFSACINLESIDLSENIDRIEYDVFNSCIRLKSIVIPASVTLLYANCFAACISLEKIIFCDNCVRGYDEFENVSAGVFFGYCMSLSEVYIMNADTPLDHLGYAINPDYTKEQIIELVDKYLYERDSSEDIFSYIFGDWESHKTDDLNIHGYKGSTAETYANEHGFKFVPICDHINTETINAAVADCENDGYTGDVYCNDCEEIIEYGEVITATGHADADNNYICDVCETELEVQNPEPEVPETPEEPDYTEEEPQSFFDKIIAFFNRIFEMIKNLFGLA